MQVTMWPTDKLTVLEGVKVRVWRGVVPGGVPVFVFVHRLAVARAEDQDQFTRDLRELPPAREVSLREVL
jgi:hypothetical protein